ncbi:hypothetical protein CsSME_00002635 [Camellia sinensis var. sinensis]
MYYSTQIQLLDSMSRSKKKEKVESTIRKMPTSRLDNAASYHVMNRIIKLAKQDRRTMIASVQ